MNMKHFMGLYLGERYDPITVCHIPNQLAAVIGAVRGRVLLSHETITKQLSHHPDLTIDDYQVLRACLMMGEYRQDGPRSASILFTDTVYNSCNYRAAVKSTGDGKRIYCLSFNRIRDRQLAQARRKPYPIIKEHD
jgi:hypothetical protein